MTNDKSIIPNFNIDVKCNVNEMSVGLTNTAAGIMKTIEESEILKTQANADATIAVADATKEEIHDVADMTKYISLL